MKDFKEQYHSVPLYLNSHASFNGAASPHLWVLLEKRVCAASHQASWSGVARGRGRHARGAAASALSDASRQLVLLHTAHARNANRSRWLRLSGAPDRRLVGWGNEESVEEVMHLGSKSAT